MTYWKPKKYLPPEMYANWGGIFMAKKYEVLYKRMWVTTYRAVVVGESLHYKLYDSCEGVAKPGEWRVKGEHPAQRSATVAVEESYMAARQSASSVAYPVREVTRADVFLEDDDNILDI